MKNVSLFILLLFAAAVIARAGELIINPDRPASNASVSIKYTAGNNEFKPGEKVFANVYTFSPDNAFPVVTQLSMKSSANAYFTDYTIPDSVVFGMVKVVGSEQTDARYADFKDFYVTGTSGIVKKGAYATAAMTYMGSSPVQYNRVSDLLKALELLKKEYDLYPDDISTKVSLYSLQFDLKKITRSEFETKIRELVSGGLEIKNESALVTITRALRSIKLNDAAERLENQFVLNNPKSRIAEDKEFTSLAKARSFKEFNTKILDFIAKYPNSASREKAFSGLISSYIQMKMYNELLQILDSLPDVPASAYLNLADQITEKPDLISGQPVEHRLNEALRLQNKALTIAEVDYNGKPAYVTDKEWEDVKILDRSAVINAIGETYSFFDLQDSAKNYYTLALQMAGDKAPPVFYVNLLNTLDKQSNNKQGLEVSETALINSIEAEDILALNRKFFIRINGSDIGYDAYLGKLMSAAKEKRLAGLRTGMLDIIPDLGILENADGMTIDLRAFRGNIIVLNFWSTWCEPCGTQIKALDSLQKKLSKRQDVVIVPVNVWETATNKKQEIKEFIKANKIQLPVYLDTGETLTQKLGITGLPTTIIIDKSGAIRFRESGFENDKTITRDLEDRIDLLTDTKM